MHRSFLPMPIHLLVALAIALPACMCAAAETGGEEWNCPDPEKVALLARVPGWVSGDSITYASAASPRVHFGRMTASAHGPAALCHYRLDGGGELPIWKYANCVPAKGAWKDVGPNKVCEGSSPSDCSLTCVVK